VARGLFFDLAQMCKKDERGKERQLGCERVTHSYCINFLFVPILILPDKVDTDLASSKSVDNTP
jgi:hypothetical protein